MLHLLSLTSCARITEIAFLDSMYKVRYDDAEKPEEEKGYKTDKHFTIPFVSVNYPVFFKYEGSEKVDFEDLPQFEVVTNQDVVIYFDNSWSGKELVAKNQAIISTQGSGKIRVVSEIQNYPQMMFKFENYDFTPVLSGKYCLVSNNMDAVQCINDQQIVKFQPNEEFVYKFVEQSLDATTCDIYIASDDLVLSSSSIDNLNVKIHANSDEYSFKLVSFKGTFIESLSLSTVTIKVVGHDTQHPIMNIGILRVEQTAEFESENLKLHVSELFTASLTCYQNIAKYLMPIESREYENGARFLSIENCSELDRITFTERGFKVMDTTKTEFDLPYNVFRKLAFYGASTTEIAFDAPKYLEIPKAFDLTMNDNGIVTISHRWLDSKVSVPAGFKRGTVTGKALKVTSHSPYVPSSVFLFDAVVETDPQRGLCLYGGDNDCPSGWSARQLPGGPEEVDLTAFAALKGADVVLTGTSDAAFPVFKCPSELGEGFRLNVIGRGGVQKAHYSCPSGARIKLEAESAEIAVDDAESAFGGLIMHEGASLSAAERSIDVGEVTATPHAFGLLETLIREERQYSLEIVDLGRIGSVCVGESRVLIKGRGEDALKECSIDSKRVTSLSINLMRKLSHWGELELRSDCARPAIMPTIKFFGVQTPYVDFDESLLKIEKDFVLKIETAVGIPIVGYTINGACPDICEAPPGSTFLIQHDGMYCLVREDSKSICPSTHKKIVYADEEVTSEQLKPSGDNIIEMIVDSTAQKPLKLSGGVIKSEIALRVTKNIDVEETAFVAADGGVAPFTLCLEGVQLDLGELPDGTKFSMVTMTNGGGLIKHNQNKLRTDSLTLSLNSISILDDFELSDQMSLEIDCGDATKFVLKDNGVLINEEIVHYERFGLLTLSIWSPKSDVECLISKEGLSNIKPITFMANDIGDDPTINLDSGFFSDHMSQIPHKIEFAITPKSSQLTIGLDQDKIPDCIQYAKNTHFNFKPVGFYCLYANEDSSDICGSSFIKVLYHANEEFSSLTLPPSNDGSIKIRVLDSTPEYRPIIIADSFADYALKMSVWRLHQPKQFLFFRFDGKKRTIRRLDLTGYDIAVSTGPEFSGTQIFNAIVLRNTIITVPTNFVIDVIDEIVVSCVDELRFLVDNLCDQETQRRHVRLYANADMVMVDEKKIAMTTEDDVQVFSTTKFSSLTIIPYSIGQVTIGAMEKSTMVPTIELDCDCEIVFDNSLYKNKIGNKGAINNGQHHLVLTSQYNTPPSCYSIPEPSYLVLYNFTDNPWPPEHSSSSFDDSTSTEEESSSGGDPQQGMSPALEIGIYVAIGVVVIVLAAVLVYFITKRCKNEQVYTEPLLTGSSQFDDSFV